MIHFLEKRDEVSKKENLELKELLRSLREEYKEDAEQNRRLLKTIETLTQQVSNITAENKKLQQQVYDLLSQISVGNKVLFDSTSQKGSTTTKNVANDY